MSIMANLVIKNGQIVTPSGGLAEGWILCRDGKIAEVGHGDAPDGHVMDANGGYVLPGFVDVHIHGVVGYDAMDGSVNSILKMSEFVAQCGVTSFLPTTLTASREQTTQALHAIQQAMAIPHDGARILGAHLEGPYLNPAQSGAQNKECVRPIDRDEFLEWLELDVIRLVSVAPEQDDILWLIETCIQHGITVSAAHTTADYDTAQKAIHAGLSHATHTYNAMPKLHHRNPGALAALMLAPSVRCELIADNVHVHPAMMRLLHQTIGTDRLILITDAMRATGMDDGQYQLGEYAVTVQDGIARLADGTLAGSTLTMNRALVNLGKAIEQSIPELWKMTSYNAAQAIGCADRIGSIQEGYDADFVILDADTPETVRATVSQGKVIYNSTQKQS